MVHSVSPADLIQRQKAALRRVMRSRRRDLDPALRTQLNTALNQHLLQRLLNLPPCLVSAYLSFDGEPDLSPTFLRLQAAGFQLALPFIEEQDSHSHMIFRIWQPSDHLSENQLGFFEPSAGEEVTVEKLGVVLLPLVAWDGKGARLGMGAGYYDKALAPFRNQNIPLRIGIAFDVQRSDGIPMESHDVLLHELISDRQRFTFPA